jgi:hypothetical protein
MMYALTSSILMPSGSITTGAITVSRMVCGEERDGPSERGLESGLRGHGDKLN